MSDPKIEKARAAAQKAAEDLAALEAAEAEKAAQIEAQRHERGIEYDREFLPTWSALAQEAANNYDLSEDYDPKTLGFLEGLIQYATARANRNVVLIEAQRAESSLGFNSRERNVPEPRLHSTDILKHLDVIVRREVERRSADFADELDAKRDAYVNGGAA